MKENSVMNKLLYCSVIVSGFYILNANASDDSGMEPEIVANISQSARDKAASPDGIKAIAGLSFFSQKYEASVGKNLTSQKMTIPAFTAGFEYAKSFKNNLVLAVQVLADISSQKKQEGDWQSLNADLNTQIAIAGTRTAKLKSGFLTPSIGLKAGYWFRKRRSVAYLKLSLARITGEYSYYADGVQFAKVDTNVIAPNLIIGGEYKINKKLGAGFELGFPVNRRIHRKQINSDTEHQSKSSRVEVRLLGIYTVKADASPDSLSANFDN